MMTTLKNIDDNMHAQFHELGTQFHVLGTKLTRAQSERSGSKLSRNHLKCFGVVGQPEASQLLLVPDPDPHSVEVEAKVRGLAQGLIELYLLKNTKADEVEDIQPLTFDFFEKTCQLYFSDIWNRGLMHLAKKGTSDHTRYHVNLIDDGGIIHPVKGETDSTLWYKGVPVGVWEDKNFNFQLTDTAEVAQALAEVHYSAGVISERIGKQVGLCSGILTSGLNWTLMMKSYVKGKIIHNRTIPISLIDTSQTPPVVTNVDGVTKLVLFHLQVIQSNINLIESSSFSKISSHARIDEEDEDVAPEDNDDTEPDTNKPRIDRSGGGGRSGRRGGGKRGGGKGKGIGKQGGGNANLQLQSSNSHLTLENVYKFNLSQPIFV
jgi:hypothetical protein